MAIFDYAAELLGAKQSVLGSTREFYATTSRVAPSTFGYFQSYFNPGHNGKAKWFEYNMTMAILDNAARTSNHAITCKWQFMNNGASTLWVDFSASTFRFSSGFAGTDRQHTVAGYYNSTCKMPLRIRYTITGTSQYKVSKVPPTERAYMRAVGTAT